MFIIQKANPQLHRCVESNNKSPQISINQRIPENAFFKWKSPENFPAEYKSVDYVRQKILQLGEV
jgi:hypothetical protein